MKQRIIATILLLVTVLTMLASCVNYAFAENSMEDYVSLDIDELMKALHSIEIDEVDFGPGEKREELVVEEIYSKILAALNEDTDNEETDGTIGTNDMVKYYYYCSVKLDGVDYTFNYNMKTASNTLIGTSSTTEHRELQNAIIDAIVDGYTFAKDSAYEIKTTLNNEKITKNDRIVVSYTLKTTDGDKTTYVDYANLEITPEHDIFKDILANENAVGFNAYKTNEGVKVDNKHYLNINISHIIKNSGTSVDVVRENEEEQTLVAYDSNFAAKQIVIPESKDEAKVEITYHVFPVSFVKAPTVSAYDVIKYVLGDDITTESLTVFTENAEAKALVESLIAEYGYDADHYAGEGSAVEAAKNALDAERKLAKRQAIHDKVDALKDAKKGDETVVDAILKHVNGDKAADAEGYKTIYDIFKRDAENRSKVKFSELLPMGVIDLYAYETSAGTTAVTLINAINAEIEKDVNNAYESYTKTKSTLPDHKDNKINVADKRERYEEAVAKAQTEAVNLIIDNLLKVDGVAASIENEYKNDSPYKTEFLAYDIIKYVVLNDTTVNPSNFIEDLSDYVYGKSTLDDKQRETFSTILEELKAEFAKADSDFDSVSSVKDFKDEVEKATKAYDEAQGKTETSTTATKSISRYATLLKAYKIDANKDGKADAQVDTNADGKVDADDAAVKTAFDAIVEKYIELHPETVYVVGTANDGEKSITNTTYATEALQLIIDDVDNVAAYRAVLEAEAYLNSSNNGGALTEFNNAIDLDAKSDAVKEATEALNDARKAAKEAAVDNLIAKLLSGVLEETQEDSNKLSVVLPVRYVESTLNTKINSYNTSVRNNLANAIYEIINNQVVVNTDGEGYPWALVEEFEKTIKEGYKSAFYTGTSDKTTAGSFGSAITEEDRAAYAAYKDYTAKLDEANEAITSAKTGYNASTTAYITALTTIYDIEVALKTADADLLLGSDTDAKAYYDAYKAHEAAKTANATAKNALAKANNDLAEAEEYFESVKDEGFTIFHKEWWNANAEVKAAKKAVEEATEKVEGTKKVDGTQDTLDKATKALNDAKDALVESISTEDVENVDFVAAKKDLEDKKTAYNNKANASSTTNSITIKITKYKEALATYEAADKAVTDAGEAATEEQKKALEDAEKALETAKTPLTECRTAAKDYVDSALVYYAESKVVENKANAALTAEGGIYDMLEIETDEDGNITKEGLKEKIATAEKFEKGETLTNVEVYGHLDAYLEGVLGYNWKAVIREQAIEAVNEQIKFYAVAKALVEEGVVAGTYEFHDEENGIHITTKGYKAAIEEIEARDVDEETGFGTIKKVLAHSIEHNDEGIKTNKLKREVKKAYEALIESTDYVFVNDKAFKAFKKELGRANYADAKEQVGENNLRMWVQVDNLLNYLLYTDVQVNDYAMHEGEYTVRELEGENGEIKLAYLFINYEFKDEDAK